MSVFLVYNKFITQKKDFYKKIQSAGERSEPSDETECPPARSPQAQSEGATKDGSMRQTFSVFYREIGERCHIDRRL